MGGHYGSVQLRTTDRAAVLAAADAVATARGIKCLVGPTLNGWVGVYPEGHGQDQTVGEHIAACVGGYGLHLLVHDDDVLAYWLWNEGKLIDRYWSKPGYFGEENRAEEELLVGDANVFAFALDTGALERLRKLLDRQSATSFESDRLQNVCRILGMRNGVSAFEYLTGDEREGIVGWKRFSAIPFGRAQAEKARRAEAKARIKHERSRLRSAGMLLLSDERKQFCPKVCAVVDGFIVVWQGLAGQDRQIDYHRPPWRSSRETLDSQLPQSTYLASLAADRHGASLAIAFDDVIRIWFQNGSAWNSAMDIGDARRAVDLAFSFDGRRIAFKTHATNEVVVSEVSSGLRVATSPWLNMNNEIAFSPDGQWLFQSAMTLGIQSIGDAENFRSVRVCGLSPQSSISPDLLTNFVNIKVESVMAKKRTEFEKEFEVLQRENDASANPKTPDQLIAVRETFEKVLASMHKGLTKFKNESSDPAKYRSEHCFCVGFDARGKWLWVGTEIGLRVYSCEAVVAGSGEELPLPIWSFDLPVVPLPTFPNLKSGYVYAAAGEPNGEGVVFGGLTGELFRLRFADGEVDRLIAMPGGGAIFELAMSVDGETLGVCSSLRDRHGMPLQSAWEIWNYRALLSEIEKRPPADLRIA